MKFVKLSNKRFPKLQYGWVLEVSNLSDLAVVLEWRTRIAQTAFSSAVISKEFSDKNSEHCNDFYGHAAIVIAQEKEVSLIGIISEIEGSIAESMSGMLEKYGKFLVNRNGGYMPPSDDLIIEDTVLNDKLFFPVDSVNYDVRYLQWPNGTHWYAKIGNTDVDVDGKMKWDTREDAEKAVNKYIFKLKEGGPE